MDGVYGRSMESGARRTGRVMNLKRGRGQRVLENRHNEVVGCSVVE